MIINNAFYTLPPASADEAETMLRELRGASRSEKGCLTFIVGRDVEQPATFALYEEYRDQAALDAHFASDHFQRLVVNGLRKMATDRIGHRCNEI